MSPNIDRVLAQCEANGTFANPILLYLKRPKAKQKEYMRNRPEQRTSFAASIPLDHLDEIHRKSPD